VYTPRQTYQPTPVQTSDSAPAPEQTTQTREPSTPPTTRRRTLTPTPKLSPSFSPHVTVSRGS
jgi:hypothetical protein